MRRAERKKNDHPRERVVSEGTVAGPHHTQPTTYTVKFSVSRLLTPTHSAYPQPTFADKLLPDSAEIPPFLMFSQFPQEESHPKHPPHIPPRVRCLQSLHQVAS